MREEAGWRYKYVRRCSDRGSYGTLNTSVGFTTFVLSDSIRYIIYELYGEVVTVEVDSLPFVYILPEDYENRGFIDADGNVVRY